MGQINIIHLRPSRICKDGVQDYQELLISSLQRTSGTLKPGVKTEFSELRLNDLLFYRVNKNKSTFIHCQLPMIAWRFNLFLPLIVLMKLRYQSTELIVTLHEWSNTHWLRRIINYFLIWKAFLIIVPSQELKNELESFSFIRKKKIPIEVVPIGPNIIVKKKETSVKENRSTKKVQTIGHFGFLYPLKNPNTVLMVFKEITKLENNVELVFVGDFLNSRSKEKKQFNRLMDSLQLRDKVNFKGYLKTEDEVLNEMGKWDIYISLHENGFSLRHGSTLAALQLGIPVISYEPKKGFSQFEQKWLVEIMKGRNLIFIKKDLEIGKVAGVILQHMNAGEKKQPMSLDWIWDEIAKMHLDIYHKYLLELRKTEKYSENTK